MDMIAVTTLQLVAGDPCGALFPYSPDGPIGCSDPVQRRRTCKPGTIALIDMPAMASTVGLNHVFPAAESPCSPADRSALYAVVEAYTGIQPSNAKFMDKTSRTVGEALGYAISMMRVW